MGMSYKRAWDMVDFMNRMAGGPLVTKKSGGKGGGGAVLTGQGHRAVDAFRALQKRFRTYLAEETRQLLAELAQDTKP